MDRYISGRDTTHSREFFQFRRDNPYGIAHVGYLNYTTATQPLVPHAHPDVVELVFVEKGAPYLTFEDVPYLVKSGQCFMCPPGRSHGSGSIPLDRMKMYWLGYRPEKVSRCLFPRDPESESGRRDFVRSVSCDEPLVFYVDREIRRNLEGLLRLCRSREPGFHLSAMVELSGLFRAVSSGRREEGKLSDKMDEVCRYIDGNLENPLILEDLASMVNLSESRFKVRFRNETGLPPREYILRRRTDRSKELLAEGRSILYTAAELGFSSSQYFATVFRRYTSLSPSQWLQSSSRNEVDAGLPDAASDSFH